MPSFGRLSKHSNRSQHALPDQLSTGASSGSAGSGSGATQAQQVPGQGQAGSAPAASATGSGASTGAAQAQAQAQAQQGSGPLGGALGSVLGSAAQADSPAEAAPQSALSSTTALSSSDHLETFVDARPSPQTQQQLQQQQQQLQHQQQHHQQQNLPPPPPPHLFNPQHPSVNLPPQLQTSGPAGSPAFDGHQPPTPIDFDPSVSRSQSQRYGAPLTPQQQQQLQHQQLYGVASGSIDDLPSTGGYLQQPPPPQQQSVPAPAPQKRSTRKLIKGIFGSSRESHDAHQQQQQQQQQQHLQQQQQHQPPPQPSGHNPSGPYDNTTGLARRPSKRVSNPPNLKTTSPSQTTQLPHSADRDLQPHGQYSQQPSPLHDVGEVDEYSLYGHGSNVDSPLQDSRILLTNNGIRQVSTEHLEASPYDEVYQPPDHPPPPQQLQHQHHSQHLSQQQQQQQQQQTPPPLQQPQPQPLQRQGTLRIQEQQAQYESQQQLQQQHGGASYDQQSQQGGRQQPNFHYPTNSAQGPYQPAGEPRLITSQLITSQQLQNAETISQLSHDSPVTDPDPRSTFQQHPGQQSQQGSHHASTPSQDIPPNQLPGQGVNPQAQDQSAMAPPPPGGGPQSSRRVQDAEKVHRESGPPPGYHRQGSVSLSGMSPIPPPGQGAPSIAGYRGDRGSLYIDASPGVDQGRNSPQPSDRDPDMDKQFKDLLVKYKNVKRLYFDGKSQIELLNGQIEQLQNAVANQRMSQSRTAWDDNEYSTRFNRLNGAINNLSFNIRKDWRSLPSWLETFVSADALKTGKQEMTAVGRAVVSRWLVEELFNKCFHPALDTQLSSQLKEIELSIRGNSHTMHHQEEVDAHTTKVVNWRMATLDGLQKRLNSNAAADNRGMLTNKITTNLTAYLYQYLNSPPPPGVEGSTSMIAELAVAIAANLPLESRDVSIMYPLPGDLVQPSMMEVEKAGLPQLEAQRGDVDADSDSDDDDVDDKDKGSKSRGDKGKPGLPKDPNRVRFAGFVALEVRGRQVLMKAPVWTL